MSVEALSFLCNNLTIKIKKLSLFGIYAIDSKDYILEDEHVIAITNGCPELEELDLGGWHFISEVAVSAIIEKLKNLVKLKLPNTDQITGHIPLEKLQNLIKPKLHNTGQIQLGKLLELRSMPNLKYLNVNVDLDIDLFDLFEVFPEEDSENVDEKIDELKRATPFIKALMKNLPNLKINEGKFKIAAHDPHYIKFRNSVWLWELQFQPTDDFLGPLW